MKIFTSPSKYMQGSNILETEIEIFKEYGQKLALLSDDNVYHIIGSNFHKHLENQGLEVTYIPFNGEASNQEINRVSDICRKEKTEIIVGLGGGKTIDSAKAIADEINQDVIIIPTIASTDAPTSALSVIYSEAGVFEGYRFYKKNPDLVLIDTQVVANAPSHLLVAGIGDALATYIEGRSIYEGNGDNMLGGKATLAALAIAEKCQDTLFENAKQAISACERQVTTEALEQVVEANTLLSGVGFESCGLAAAHSIHNGFTALSGDIHQLSHGEKVAYGTLTQLVLENRSKEELDRYLNFYKEIGLPTRLNDLHLDQASKDNLMSVAELATQEGETIHQMQKNYTAQDVYNAIVTLDSYNASF